MYQTQMTSPVTSQSTISDNPASSLFSCCMHLHLRTGWGESSPFTIDHSISRDVKMRQLEKRRWCGPGQRITRPQFVRTNCAWQQLPVRLARYKYALAFGLLPLTLLAIIHSLHPHIHPHILLLTAPMDNLFTLIFGASQPVDTVAIEDIEVDDEDTPSGSGGSCVIA